MRGRIANLPSALFYCECGAGTLARQVLLQAIWKTHYVECELPRTSSLNTMASAISFIGLRFWRLWRCRAK